MLIGVLAPMPSELRPVVRAGRLTAQRRDGNAVHRGAVGDVEVVAARAGIGTVRAGRATRELLEEFAADHVVICGIAGGLGTTAIGDLVIPAVAIDHSTGATYRAAPLGAAEPQGSLVTSGRLITDPVALGTLAERGFAAIDMETAAIAAVCAERKVPWTAFRAISDLAGVDVDGAVLSLVDPTGKPRLGAAARHAVIHPHHIAQLARLGRRSALAARIAARAAVDACRAHGAR